MPEHEKKFPTWNASRESLLQKFLLKLGMDDVSICPVRIRLVENRGFAIATGLMEHTMQV